MGPSSAAEDDYESSKWANDISRFISQWHEEQFVPAIFTVLKSRLPPRRQPSLRSTRTLDEEAALQARIREHMRHKVQITREILAQDAVERTFLSWRDSALKNQLQIAELGTTAVLARFQEQREKRHVATRAADWIHTEQAVYLSLDMLSLESQRLASTNLVQAHDTHNLLSALQCTHTQFEQTLQTADSTSPEVSRLLLTLQSAFANFQTRLQSSTHPIQQSVLSSLLKTLHHFRNVTLSTSSAAGEWTHLTTLLSFLRDAEKRQRFARLQAGVRAIRRKTKARMMISALDTLVSSHAELEAKLNDYQLQYRAEATTAILDFLNVQWRVHRIVRAEVETEKTTLALAGLLAGLRNFDDTDAKAQAQKEAADKIDVNRMLHAWRLREQQVRAREEVELFEKEVMGETSQLEL